MGLHIIFDQSCVNVHDNHKLPLITTQFKLTFIDLYKTKYKYKIKSTGN